MTKCTGVPPLSLGHDGEIYTMGVAFVNPERRTLARSSYPAPDLRSAYPGPNCVGTGRQPWVPRWPLPGKAAVATDLLCRQSLTRLGRADHLPCAPTRGRGSRVSGPTRGGHIGAA